MKNDTSSQSLRTQVHELKNIVSTLVLQHEMLSLQLKKYAHSGITPLLDKISDTIVRLTHAIENLEKDPHS